MLSRLMALGLATSLFACVGQAGPSPYDDDYPLSGEGDVIGGAPPNSTLPDDNKADAVYPRKLFLSEQSPVRNQGHRGVCSIFAATALVENLYIKAGLATPDFSEQYMQWAVKNLDHSFPDSEGSDAGSNLETVVQFGTVAEVVWPYDINPWSTANDPACTGTSQPTKCWTNGEPPAAAATAQKFKLPSSRWLNVNSIKAHINDKKTAVAVGMTFFFQSWNHRLSTLPISSDLWAQGVVTYPNAKDKELSLAEHEGHAILIVGWDDDAEFAMRDEKSQPILGADGKPQTEKGFYIFKNSWNTQSFGVENPNGAGYGYLSYKYVDEYGSAVIAEIPSLDTPPPPPPPTGTTHDYTAAPAAAIPDNDPTGVSSTIDVADTGTLTGATVTVAITHTYRGDLRVTLVHGSDTIALYSGEGDASADNLQQTFTVNVTGKALKGAWTLHVVDTAAQDTGTLDSWKLETTSN
jgi:C1A family cysteine protease